MMEWIAAVVFVVLVIFKVWSEWDSYPAPGRFTQAVYAHDLREKVAKGEITSEEAQKTMTFYMTGEYR